MPRRSHSRESSISSLASAKLLNIAKGPGPLSSNPPTKRLTVKTVRFSKPNPIRSVTAPPRLTKQHSIKRDTATFTATATFTIPMRSREKYSTVAGAPKFLPLGEERKGLFDKELPAPPVVVEVFPENERKEEEMTALPRAQSLSIDEETQAMTQEFDGDLETNHSLPSRATLRNCQDIPIFDSTGKEHRFGDLWEDDHNSQKRVLIIFIRHFFCGVRVFSLVSKIILTLSFLQNCQEYIRTLSSQLPPSSLPPNTSIAVIGCGAHSLIPTYTELTSSPYPIYADPSRRLYSQLGMAKTLSLGKKDPEYIQHSLMVGAWQSIVQGLKRVGEGDVLKAGDMRQVGGEFLVEGGKVSWCHRMRNTRDHAEISELRSVLGILDATPAGNEQKPEPKQISSEQPRRRLPQRRWTTSTIARSISRTSQHWVEKRTGGRASGRTTRNRSASAGATGKRSSATTPDLPSGTGELERGKSK